MIRLDRHSSSLLVVILVFALIGPLIGTIYTAIYNSHEIFNASAFFWGYAFGIPVACLAGAINWMQIYSYLRNGSVNVAYAGIYQGVKSGLITTVIVGALLCIDGLPRDWPSKMAWFSSACILSSSVCSLIINNAVIKWNRS